MHVAVHSQLSRISSANNFRFWAKFPSYAAVQHSNETWRERPGKDHAQRVSDKAPEWTTCTEEIRQDRSNVLRENKPLHGSLTFSTQAIRCSVFMRHPPWMASWGVRRKNLAWCTSGYYLIHCSKAFWTDFFSRTPQQDSSLTPKDFLLLEIKIKFHVEGLSENQVCWFWKAFHFMHVPPFPPVWCYLRCRWGTHWGCVSSGRHQRTPHRHSGFVHLHSPKQTLRTFWRKFEGFIWFIPKAVRSGLSGGNQNTTSVRHARNTQGMVSMYVESTIFRCREMS